MNAEVRAAVLERAGGLCECGCGERLRAGEIDHFWGRGREEETVENCWLLKIEHHRDKTDNKPSRADWLDLFAEHCRRHGYAAEALKAAAKAFYARAKAEADASPRVTSRRG